MAASSGCSEPERYSLLWSCLDMSCWFPLHSPGACKLRLVETPSEVSLLNILHIPFALGLMSYCVVCRFFFLIFMVLQPSCQTSEWVRSHPNFMNKSDCLPQKEKYPRICFLTTLFTQQYKFWHTNYISSLFLIKEFG